MLTLLGVREFYFFRLGVPKQKKRLGNADLDHKPTKTYLIYIEIANCQGI